MKKMTTNSEVYDLFSASTASAVLGASIETGLLWLLADEPLEATRVSQALNIPIKRCAYWLQLLEALGLLDKSPQGYVTSALAHAALLETRSRASWEHLAVDERERSAGVHNLALYISEPGSIWAAQGLTEPKNYVVKMRADYQRAREFTRMLFEVHQYLGNELAALLDLAGVNRMLDVGGNSGVISMALLRKYPDLTSTVFDIENVCIAGREIAVETGFSDRITYCPLDLKKDAFPGGFDLAMLCDVPIFGEDFFRRLWTSLNPGGRFVLVFHFFPGDNLAHPRQLEWSFLDSLEDPGFSYPTIPQVRADLVRAGFHPLPGEHTLSDKRIVIQAQK